MDPSMGTSVHVSDPPAVILVVRDAAQLALRTLVSLAECQSGVDFHTVLIDDGSTDHLPAILAGVQGDFTTAREDRPRGFASGCDRAVAACEHPIVVFLREDLVVTQDWLAHAMAPFADPSVGAVRPRVLDLAGREHTGPSWPCLAVRRQALEQVGGVTASARNGRAVKDTFLDAITAAGWTVAAAPDSLLLYVPEAASEAASTMEF